ncbi:sodium/potassium/calcium exchanger 1 isoform X1 [Lepisosteus oculatus]|uniref:sodium/potassium/calcium exchanger 1 isoform X1 n=1 Tax=Lepisosteus oculatus TaxID=7918 RepID=UPI0037118DBD
MYLSRRKRLQWNRIVFILLGVLICYVYQLSFKSSPTASAPWTERYAGSPPGTAGEGDVEGESELGVDGRELSSHTTEGTASAATTEASPSTKTTTTMTTPPAPTTLNRTNIRHCIYVDPEPPKPTAPPSPTPPPNATAAPSPVPNATAPPHGGMPHLKAEYPEDIFSVEQRRQGWVSLHIFGMIYMFVSLAIVCDEFFVPALGVITDKLEISDDVAGATFMAAGGSAPELFTSLIGVFISHSNIGIGTIVGSAVFNILFVIGMCALFSREILHLTWWPLFRDVSFYILDLMMLIVFFLDNAIMWWESMLLVTGYCSYVLFMKYNVQLEHAFKTQLNKHKSIVKVIALEEPEKSNGSLSRDNAPPQHPPLPPEDKNRLKLKPTLQRGGSSASLHNSTMRNTIFQLMIHTLDPLGEESIFNREVKLSEGKSRAETALSGDVKPSCSVQGTAKFKDKAEIMNNMARGKVESKGQAKSEDTNLPNAVNVQVTPPPEPSTSQPAPKEEEKTEQTEGQKPEDAAGSGGSGSSEDDSDDSDDDSDEDSEDEEEDEEEDEIEEPLSLEWPETRRKQATYLFLLPIVFPLWLTVPDVRNPASKKFFAITFLGSIIWIAVFSYLMVWWAHQVGETIGISEEIMGLTILAAGTSIPDLITSVIVARKGLGDMAVSSSVGSNIFDITVGLPVPWLMYTVFNGMVPVQVSSNGLFCAIVLLFLMLLFVIISIAVCKWRMNKLLGCTMFGLYFLFLVVSVMLEDRIIICPVSI